MNTFQLVFIARENTTYFMFNYPPEDIGWWKDSFGRYPTVSKRFKYLLEKLLYLLNDVSKIRTHKLTQIQTRAHEEQMLINRLLISEPDEYQIQRQSCHRTTRIRNCSDREHCSKRQRTRYAWQMDVSSRRLLS